MRTQIRPYLNCKVSGYGTITEINSRHIKLEKIFLTPDIDEDHCWIHNISKMINIRLGERIFFHARVYQYRKKVKNRFQYDYGLEILDWRPLSVLEAE